MHLNDITTKVNKLANTWEQFKSVNERRLDEIEKKGSSDPLTLEQLKKMNESMTKYQDSLDKIETVLNRPSTGTDMLKAGDCEYKRAFCNYVKKGIESEIANLERKQLSNPNNEELGYSVTYKMNENISTLLTQNSPTRQISNVMEISSDALELIEDKEEGVSVVGRKIRFLTLRLQRKPSLPKKPF